MKKNIIVILVIVLMTAGVTWLYINLPGGADKVQPTETAEIETVDTSVSFEEIYHEYKSNKLRAKEKYYDNRYRITATINGMSTTGLLNATGGATLTMETRIDDTIVFFYAEFEKDQEDALKNVNVGNTITFNGTCLSAGSWTDCELITE